MKINLKPQLQKIIHSLIPAWEKSGLAEKLEPVVSKYKVLSAAEKRIVQTGAAMALMAIYLFNSFSPTVANFNKGRQDYEKYSNELILAKSDIAATATIHAAHENAVERTAELNKVTLNDATMTDFLDELSKIANNSNIDIAAFDPNGPSTFQHQMPRLLPTGYILLSYTLKGRAAYHDLGRFLQALETHTTYIRIAFLEINHDSGDTSRLHDFTLNLQLIKNDNAT
ncbi:MAG: hypothetical protein ACI9CF_001721 [Candidatus Omnitrophota bacterium]|jgi:hypothetical protein